MPEIISKYPDVTKQVLESAGARCGQGLPQKILTRCPRESFCAFPGGEVCVFGVDQVSAMTQVRREEICGAAAKPTLADLGAAGGALGVPVLVATLFAATVRRRRSR